MLWQEGLWYWVVPWMQSVKNLNEKQKPGKLRSYREEQVYTVTDRKQQDSPVYVIKPENGNWWTHVMHRILLLPGDFLPLAIDVCRTKEGKQEETHRYIKQTNWVMRMKRRSEKESLSSGQMTGKMWTNICIWQYWISVQGQEQQRWHGWCERWRKDIGSQSPGRSWRSSAYLASGRTISSIPKSNDELFNCSDFMNTIELELPQLLAPALPSDGSLLKDLKMLLLFKSCLWLVGVIVCAVKILGLLKNAFRWCGYSDLC